MYSLDHNVFKIISDVADEHNIETYVIGGYVRDLIIGRTSKDIDIVAVGSGIELANNVSRKIGDKTNVTIFKNFGTAMLKFEDMEIEFVGARKESYQRNSRKPIVETGTLDDDQKRRDFTINALAISLNKKNYGNLLDPFNGIGDIDNCIIKTPLDPDITFSDDPLRMMRAARFASQLGFTIEDKTFEALLKNKERISIVSKERIAEEFNKILLSPVPSIGLTLLSNSGILKLIFPEMELLKGVEIINGIAHKDNFIHTLKVLDNISLKSNNLWLRWAALLHDIAKPETKRFTSDAGWTFHSHEIVGSHKVVEIFKKFKLPQNEKMKYVEKLVQLHLRPIALTTEDISDSAVRRLLYESGEDINDLMTLGEADITSKNEEKVKKYLSNFQLVKQKLIEIEEKDAIRNFQPPLSGEEIMSIFELPPCKIIGDLKNSLKDAILDGIIKNDYDEALEYIKQKASEIGILPKNKIV